MFMILLSLVALILHYTQKCTCWSL